MCCGGLAAPARPCRSRPRQRCTSHKVAISVETEVVLVPIRPCPASTSSPEEATPQSDPLSTAFCPPHNGARRNEQQFVEVVLVRSSGPSPARRELIQLCLRPRLGHTPPENPSRSSRALSSRQYPSVIQVRFPWPKRAGSGYRRRLSSRQDGGRHTRTISLNPLYDRLTFQCRGTPNERHVVACDCSSPLTG